MSAYAQSIRDQSSNVDPTTIEMLDPDGCGLIMMEVFAHFGPIKDISYSELRDSMFTSCEKTRKVRIWNPFTMDLEGIIDQKTMR